MDGCRHRVLGDSERQWETVEGIHSPTTYLSCGLSGSHHLSRRRRRTLSVDLRLGRRRRRALRPLCRLNVRLRLRRRLLADFGPNRRRFFRLLLRQRCCHRSRGLLRSGSHGVCFHLGRGGGGCVGFGLGPSGGCRGGRRLGSRLCIRLGLDSRVGPGFDGRVGLSSCACTSPAVRLQVRASILAGSRRSISSIGSGTCRRRPLRRWRLECASAPATAALFVNGLGRAGEWRRC